MRRKKAWLPTLLLGLGVFSAAAHAELLEYEFTTPAGEERALAPDAVYANPASDITFALSAGIDRKVRISVKASDGQTVSTKVSHLLGAQDRISVNGRSYYGAKLTTPALQEGRYEKLPEVVLVGVDDSGGRSDPVSLH